jgi:hypothetical protein
MHRKISDFHLEQYLLGEAPEWVNKAVKEDPEVLARVRALEEDNEAFFRDYPADETVASIQERVEAEEERESVEETVPDWAKASSREEAAAQVLRALLGSLTLRPGIAVGAVAAAAAVAVLLALPFFLTQTPEAALGGRQDEYVRLKGMDPSLSIYIQNPSGEAKELTSGETVSAGDTLQVAYIAAGARHGMIFSVDGRGTVTLHFPASPFESDALERGGEVSLPYSYTLDDAPRFERFFFVAASEPVDVAGVMGHVEEIIASDGADALDAPQVARLAAIESDLEPEEVGVDSFAVSK